MNQKSLRAAALAVLSTFVLSACGAGGAGASVTPTVAASPVSTPSSSGASENTVLAAVKWAAGMTVSFPTSCSVTISTTSAPNHAVNAYYLAPATGSQTVVATTPTSHTAMALVSYTAPTQVNTATINTCPTLMATTTQTNLGAIGWMISGAALFNPYEANASTVAMSDNVSYTSGSITAAFIDSCNGHTTPGPEITYHYHGISSCVTSEVDTPSGPSHIIGIALDGFPIYGDRDINGNQVSLSSLDACNGITSPTPEFPNGIYHYVLPSGVTNAQSSLNCYHGL